MSFMIDDRELRKKYNPDGSDLRNMQLRMLEILKCVDSICKKHQIRYWLSGGTLLGAVRHGGFIPWDDDLDIEMMRDDFLKLMKILPEELPSQYKLQTYQSDSKYCYLYAKVRDLNSEIIEQCPVNQKFKYRGIFIDIFSLEPSQSKIAKISAVLYNRLCFGLAGKSGLLEVFYKFNHFFLISAIFPFFRLFLRKKKPLKVGYELGVNFLKQLNFDSLFPLITVKFEDHEFPAPKDTDDCLKNLYGDYMTIPEHKDVHLLDGQVKIW